MRFTVFSLLWLFSELTSLASTFPRYFKEPAAAADLRTSLGESNFGVFMVILLLWLVSEQSWQADSTQFTMIPLLKLILWQVCEAHFNIICGNTSQPQGALHRTI